MIAVQLLKEEDLINLRQDQIDIYDQIIYREILANQEFMKHLETKLNEVSARLGSSYKSESAS